MFTASNHPKCIQLLETFKSDNQDVRVEKTARPTATATRSLDIDLGLAHLAPLTPPTRNSLSTQTNRLPVHAKFSSYGIFIFYNSMYTVFHWLTGDCGDIFSS